jgi:TRAP-type mannitol/chloroaromatic compound transport system permease small subunit
MKIIKAICKVIDKVNDVLGNIFSVLVLGILAVILCEVVLRRLFNKPQIWTQDLIVMLFACYTILICAYGFQKKAFVAVDVVFAMLPQLAQHILHIITYLCYLVPFTTWILPKTFNFFLKAYTTHEQTYSVWAVVTWPEKLCFFIGFLLLTIQAVSEILKEFVAAVETVQAKKALPADGKEANG